MNIMKRAHQVRKEMVFQLQRLSYQKQMSLCLKKAYSETVLKKYNEKLKQESEAKLLKQKKEAVKKMKQSKVEMKNKTPYQPKQVSEIDLAKGAFTADQRDRNKDLKVRAW